MPPLLSEVNLQPGWPLVLVVVLVVLLAGAFDDEGEGDDEDEKTKITSQFSETLSFSPLERIHFRSTLGEFQIL